METALAGMHPTKRALIRAVSAHLDANLLEELNSEKILKISGTSKGSLYHHFQDFAELVETTHVLRFTLYVDETIDKLTHILNAAQTPEEARAKFLQVVQTRQSSSSSEMRFQAAHVLSMAMHHGQLRQSLGAEQERLTQRWAEVFRECVRKGCGKPDLDPRAVAVLMQATIVGRIVDDVSPHQMEVGHWVHVIEYLLDSIFFGAKHD